MADDDLRERVKVLCDRFMLVDDDALPMVEVVEAIEALVRDEVAKERALSDSLAEALRLTKDYVDGADDGGLLPALPGWAWFDALERYRAERRDD